MKRWLLVDLYGTIVDVDWELVRVRRSRVEMGNDPRLLRASKRARPYRLTGRLSTAEAEWSAICLEAGLDTFELPNRLARAERTAISDSWFERAFFQPLAREVHEVGAKVGIASNCYRSTEEVLLSKGLNKSVDALLLSCQLGAAKPDSEFLTRALAHIQAEPSHCLFLDDAPANCEAAERHGIAAILADGTNSNLLGETLRRMGIW